MCRCRRLSVTCTFILVHGARTDCSWRTVLAWRLYSEGKFQNTTWAILGFQHVSDQCRTTAWSLDEAWRTLRGWSLLVSNCSYSLEQSNLVSVIVYNMTNMCLPGIRMCKWVLEFFFGHVCEHTETSDLHCVVKHKNHSSPPYLLHSLPFLLTRKMCNLRLCI